MNQNELGESILMMARDERTEGMKDEDSRRCDERERRNSD